VPDVREDDVHPALRTGSRESDAGLAVRRQRIDAEMAARRRAQARRSTMTLQSSAVRSAGDGIDCERAKAMRDQWERDVGLRRTIDLMRHWQDFVYQHCG
jgi:hypothetical protein